MSLFRSRNDLTGQPKRSSSMAGESVTDSMTRSGDSQRTGFSPRTALPSSPRFRLGQPLVDSRFSIFILKEPPEFSFQYFAIAILGQAADKAICLRSLKPSDILQAKAIQICLRD